MGLRWLTHSIAGALTLSEPENTDKIAKVRDSTKAIIEGLAAFTDKVLLDPTIFKLIKGDGAHHTMSDDNKPAKEKHHDKDFEHHDKDFDHHYNHFERDDLIILLI